MTFSKRLSSGLLRKYPRQFWLMFFGMLISTTGTSMVWPFMMIYVTEHLNLSLTVAASLMSLNAGVGLVASFIAGPIVDRVGRKGVLVFSLFGNGLVYLLYTQANSLPFVALLMCLAGAFNPIYKVGSDAMMADLIPPEDRADAYALLRMSNNIGIAVGPMIGGFIASASYSNAFLMAAVGLCIYGLMQFFFANETLPVQAPNQPAARREPLGGYGRVLADRKFLFFNFAFVLTTICATLIWVLLPVYAKHNYGVSESQYGLLPATNALMVVFFQLFITRHTKRYPPLFMLAIGSFIYAAAVGSVALGRGFSGFWISMVIMTVGELILVPTATTYAANLAPTDMRGRYMSIYSLTWPAASGTGPVLGGILSDAAGPAAPWLGGSASGLLAVLAYLSLAAFGRARGKAKVLPEKAAVSR